MRPVILYRLALLALGLTLVFFPAAAQGEGIVSEAEYWQLVTESRALLGRPLSAGELDALTARWQAIKQVQLPDGRITPVDNSDWLALAQSEPPDFERMAALLASLEAERDMLDLQSSHPGDLQALEEILAKPEYQWKAEAPSWLNELIQKFLDWLSGLLGEQGRVVIPVGGQAADLLVIGAMVLITVMLAYSLANLFKDFVSESALDGENGREEPLSARTALNRAETLSKEGDYRSAVRYLYLSALLILDERGLLYYDRTKTNREYLRKVAGNPKIAGLLVEVINVFDRVWYGFQPVDEETYQRYAARVRELESIQ